MIEMWCPAVEQERPAAQKAAVRLDALNPRSMVDESRSSAVTVLIRIQANISRLFGERGSINDVPLCLMRGQPRRQHFALWSVQVGEMLGKDQPVAIRL